jgi:8-amino-7-oxononanoate synthase
VALLRELGAEHVLDSSAPSFQAELIAAMKTTGATLAFDATHGFGVLGEDGCGALHHPLLQRGESMPSRLIYLATLGKAAGVAGAFVAGSADLIEWLVNKARTYIYTTAQPPLLAAAVSASLRVIAAEGWRRTHLHRLVDRLKAGAADLPWPLMPSDTPIQPLLVGGNHDTLRLAEGLKQRGILIPAIRPPTVPEGTARLRLSLSAAHSEADVDRLLTALRELAHG